MSQKDHRNKDISIEEKPYSSIVIDRDDIRVSILLKNTDQAITYPEILQTCYQAVLGMGYSLDEETRKAFGWD